MDDRSFDILARNLATSVRSRRSLALTAAGLALSLAAPLASETHAARRRGARRKQTGKAGNGKQGSSNKGSIGEKPVDDRGDGCDRPSDCPRDPETGRPGFLCSDGLCSCGGLCCEKGYACFVENSSPGREVCCYIDGDQTPLPEDAKLVACPGEFFDPNICCERDHCKDDGTCSHLTLGRYRRNPR